MITEFKAFFDLFHQGKQLANSATWKNRTIATNTLVTVLGAAAIVAKGFGYDLHLDDQTIQALGAGAVAVYGLYNAVITVITSAKVGLPPDGEAGSPGAGPMADPSP